MPKRLALQFKITLQVIQPPIWRRIQISDLSSFWDLHVAIQDAMGWEDCHLHQFTPSSSQTTPIEHIGIPETMYEGDNYDDYVTIAGWERKIRDYFSMENRIMNYEYDFGDGWNHFIEFEGAVVKDEQGKYPRCIGGARSCSPEDVGGPMGYERYLAAISDPQNEEHESYLNWRGTFNPEAFDHKKVRFTSPHQRWKKAFDS